MMRKQLVARAQEVRTAATGSGWSHLRREPINHWLKIKGYHLLQAVNKPSLAGAVLHTALPLINSLSPNLPPKSLNCLNCES